ncbi:MAG: biopolymer transporter ExbD [Pseudomonadota bacterium]|nr:biopolymer transporter ExbD [Pseudomonadota bacterium]
MTRIPRGARRFKWRRQRQERARRWPTLNLVALMDVFTILVFFFLAHSSEAESVSSGNLVSLPESAAEQRPREALVVMITRDNILLQGEPVTSVSTALRSSAREIDELRTALQEQPGGESQVQNESAGIEREVTIMGDKTIPFTLLNKVMVTCTRAGFARISLSVLQKSFRPG